MKQTIYLLIMLFTVQINAQTFEYEASKEFPYGRINPNAPKEVSDFDQMIGRCQCKSIARINQTTWADSVEMFWTFKYIMNGMAIQDETLKADGAHSGSIRQFNQDSSRWYVHYYSSSAAVSPLPTWEGQRIENGNIVLYRDSPDPNGNPGYYRLTFSKTDQGYDWIGEWTNTEETFSYATWKIFCSRIK